VRQLFATNRSISWQRLTVVGTMLVVSTVLLVTYFITDAIWRDLNIATAVAFVGSEAARHYGRSRWPTVETDETVVA